MRRLALAAVFAVPAFAQDVPAPPTVPSSSAPPILEMVLQYVIAPALPVLGGLLVFALKKLADFLTAKATESKGAFVGAKLATAAASVVAEIDVSLRPHLEAALADGKLTDKEKAELKEAALVLLKTKLPADLMKAASDIFGAFLDTHLAGLVEQAVTSRKAVSAVAESPRTP